MKDAKSNRKYKDSVFTLLFSEKSRLLELYNAIANASYGMDTDIRITTLDDALFMESINDISFVIEDKLVVLIEHQSTANPNIPLRMLIYLSKTYEKIIDRKALYSTKKMLVPKPEFIVLYNGEDECPDHQVLKLSDMFNDLEDSCFANLELIVNVYNINKGRNEEFAKRSENLKGYEFFIFLVRENLRAGMNRDEAIKQSVIECIRLGVLKEFLTEHGSEVHNMLLTGWNWDEAREDGIAIGEARGVAIGREEGVAIGEARGRHEGMEKILEYLKQGHTIAEAEALLKE